MVSTVSGRELSLVLAPGDWRVTWHAKEEGRRAEVRRIGLVEVEAGSVERCRIEGAGWTITGQVRDLDGAPTPGAMVEGCGAEATADDNGRYSLVSRRGDCLLRAWSRDGQLRRPGEAEYFDAFAPPAAIDLRVNVDPIGGVGLGLGSGTEGMSVAFVAEGSPGAAAGIVAGDVVVAVDGTSAAGWSVLRGVQAITGEPGTRVRLRIRSASGRSTTSRWSARASRRWSRPRWTRGRPWFLPRDRIDARPPVATQSGLSTVLRLPSHARPAPSRSSRCTSSPNHGEAGRPG